MEENNEKKKHGRRRHFKSKNKDKDKNVSVKQDRQSAPSDRKDQHNKETRKFPERRDTPDEDKLSDKPEKSKREPDEVIFEYTWADAWGLYGTGYHVVIKDNKERMYLSWSVDLKYGEMKIGQRLQEFLDDIKSCGVAAWDGKRYTKPGIIDGDTWAIKVNSLTLKCESQGTNEYPDEWKKLLSCLHEKWGIPVSKREQWE